MNEDEIKNVQPVLHKANDSCWAFNMNEYIRVRLTDLGYQRLADMHNEYLAKVKNWEYRNADYYKEKADKDGYTSFQMWSFMSDFGDVTGLLKPQHFHLDIQISSKYLSPCS